MSPGANGGRRSLRHLRELLEMMHVTVLPEQVVIGRANDAFDEAGHLARPEDREQVDRALDALADAVRQNEPAYA